MGVKHVLNVTMRTSNRDWVHHPARLAMRFRQQLANCCLPSPPEGRRQPIAAAAALVVLARVSRLQLTVRAQVSALSPPTTKHVRQVRQNIHMAIHASIWCSRFR